MCDPTLTDDERMRNLARELVIEDLRQLIIALDGRVPRLERTGEVDIARDAAALRREALARIAELERSACSGTAREAIDTIWPE